MGYGDNTPLSSNSLSEIENSGLGAPNNAGGVTDGGADETSSRGLPRPGADAERMARLFHGAETHHGTYNPTKVTTSDKGKKEIKPTAKNISRPPTIALWQQHLDGERPLGVSPVCDDSNSVWAVIDIDEYDLSHRGWAEKVENLNLPLIVCRSKSNGAHLFLFLKKPMPTADLRACMRDMLPLLGLPPKQEIFPKQDSATEVDFTSWLNMPYFKADGGDRYAVNSEGKGLSLKRFLDLSERSGVLPTDLPAIIKAAALQTGEDDDDGAAECTLEWFEEWFGHALSRIEKAPHGKADDTLFGVAKDVGKFLAEIQLDLPAVKARAQEAWKERGKPLDEFDMQWERNVRAGQRIGMPPRKLSLSGTRRETEFYAYMEMHQYFYIRGDSLWPAASIDGKFGMKDKMKASKWLDKYRTVEQAVWAPGMPKIIENQQLEGEKWKPVPGTRVYNLYNAPDIGGGDASDVRLWLNHIHRIYPNEADHIVKWFAHRVQHPGDKVNHALVLGGNQGIGKDTILVPVFNAIGSWNVQTISPKDVFGDFNDFVKAVILLINEVHDLGDHDRHQFYERTKSLTTAPPTTHRYNEKHRKAIPIFNVCGVIMTTNHKSDGIALPEDDRRTYVAWSEASKEEFDLGYWNAIWNWYHRGGMDNIAAFLRGLDLSGFEAKEDPPKTAAWRDIVYANRAPEDADMRDALETLGNPDAVTVEQMRAVADDDFRNWLSQPRFRRQIPHRFNTAGYERITNEGMKNGGDWKINGRYQAIYVKKELSARDKLAAAMALCARAAKEP